MFLLVIGFFFVVGSKNRIVNTILVDQSEPPSHKKLREILESVCPWLKNEGRIQFESISLEEFEKNGRLFKGH